VAAPSQSWSLEARYLRETVQRQDQRLADVRWPILTLTAAEPAALTDTGPR